ncbi:DDE_3 domain-containing protein [Trichonephila clavipes]|nr:DDE_3 domain-containing protein [Trichonephila clavipes]
MVWAGIMINGRTRLHVVANGTMTGQRYIDEVLLSHVRLFRGAVGNKFVFMDDNATCHRTLAVQDCLDSEGIQSLVWPARSPVLNSIENVWDALGRQVAGRNYPPTNKNTLISALTEEWDKLPQQLLDNVVQKVHGGFDLESHGLKTNYFQQRVPMTSEGLSGDIHCSGGTVSLVIIYRVARKPEVIAWSDISFDKRPLLAIDKFHTVTDSTFARSLSNTVLLVSDGWRIRPSLDRSDLTLQLKSVWQAVMQKDISSANSTSQCPLITAFIRAKIPGNVVSKRSSAEFEGRGQRKTSEFKENRA